MYFLGEAARSFSQTYVGPNSIRFQVGKCTDGEVVLSCTVDYVINNEQNGKFRLFSGGDAGEMMRLYIWVDFNIGSGKLEILSEESYRNEFRTSSDGKAKIYNFGESKVADYIVYANPRDAISFFDLLPKPEIQRMCLGDSIRYLAGAAIKLRKSNSKESKELATLKYNSQVCKIEEAKDWTKIYSPAVEAEGWILKQYLVAEEDKEPWRNKKLAMDSYGAKDFGNAVKYMERLLDIEDENDIEELILMKTYYQAAGMIDRAKILGELINTKNTLPKSTEVEN